MGSINNRNKAFASIVEQLPLKRKKVLEVIIKLGKCSLDEIAHYMFVNKNEISGRITELKDSFLIKEVNEYKKSTRSNNAVTVYEIIENGENRKKLIIDCINKINKDIFLLRFYTRPSEIHPERLIYLINKDLKSLENKSKRLEKILKTL